MLILQITVQTDALAGEMPDGGQRRILFPLAPEYVGYADAGLSEDMFASRKPQIELLENRQFKYRVDFDALELGENVAALCLSRPTNPTGNTFAPKLIRTLTENFTGIVVVDEAYIDFSTQESCTQWLQEYPNLVVLQTFSKAWGLAGIRLGMAFASTEIITLFNKVKPPYNINQLTQNAAHQALDDTASFQSKLDYLIQQRSWLKNALSQLHEVEKIYPSNTNFLLVKIKDCNTLFEHLTQQKIIVRNRSKVHLCEGCLRFTVGTAEENKRLIKEIQLFFS